MKHFLTSLVLLVLAANSADVPSTEALKAEMERELTQKVESRLDPTQLAVKYRLPTPVLPPTMTREEIEARIASQVERESEEKFPNRDEEFAAEAAEKYPMVELRETITVQVKRGGVTTGVLYENNNAYIKVSSYRIHKVDLVGESLALLDPEANEKYRRKHIYKRRADVEVSQERLADKIRGELGKALYVKAGYVQRNGKWMAQNELLDAAMEHETRLLRKKYAPYIKKAVLEKYGFQLVEGRWQRPEDVVAVAESQAVHESAVEPEPVSEPEAAPDAPPPPPPPVDESWDWGLPSKIYSLASDTDLPTPEQLWKIEAARVEPLERPSRKREYSGYFRVDPGWAEYMYGYDDHIDLPYPKYTGKGTLRNNFFKVK
jgi:hypothetical protein